MQQVNDREDLQSYAESMRRCAIDLIEYKQDKRKRMARLTALVSIMNVQAAETRTKLIPSLLR